VILNTDEFCETALWHLEARFGKPDVKDGSNKGWTLSKTRFLAFYDVRNGTWRCDVTLARTP
jgi:hypothetical protein